MSVRQAGALFSSLNASGPKPVPHAAGFRRGGARSASPKSFAPSAKQAEADLAAEARKAAQASADFKARSGMGEDLRSFDDETDETASEQRLSAIENQVHDMTSMMANLLEKVSGLASDREATNSRKSRDFLSDSGGAGARGGGLFDFDAVDSEKAEALVAGSTRVKMGQPLAPAVIASVTLRHGNSRFPFLDFVQAMELGGNKGVTAQLAFIAKTLDSLLFDSKLPVSPDHPAVEHLIRRLLGLRKVADSGGDWGRVDQFMPGAALADASMIPPEREAAFASFYEKKLVGKAKKKDFKSTGSSGNGQKGPQHK